ncbi:MAG: hypothetical protein LIR50_17400 [Bacillota bacterium]|nr:hypothetical protein [Bacillota bacterium]
MNLIKYIEQEEKEAIGYYIDSYAESSLQVSVDKILKPWEINKQPLFTVFGKRFILEKDINYIKQDDELLEDIGNLLTHNYNDTVIRKFTSDWNDHFRYFFRVPEENNSINEMKKNLSHLLDDEVLLSGVWDYDTCEIKLEDMSKPVKIQRGAHIMKFIRKFAEMYHIDGFEQFRIKHSQIMNQRKLSGKLCLSIHPFDYMTMSDNNCGWSSCMSWVEEGCYRQGTVEMMNSPCVVVAYLKAKDDMKVHNIYWNNKKWRELFIVTPEIITNIKSYPYYNSELSKIALNWLKELAENAGFGHYMDKEIAYNAFREFSVDGIDYDCIISPSTDHMYNDFGSSQDHNFIYITTDKNLYNGGTFRINYSGPSECMSCGNVNEYFSSEQNLSCTDCYAPRTCDECGCILGDNDGWYVDGSWFCEDCVDECTYVDPITEERHLINTGEITVYPASNDGKSYYPDFHIILEDCTFENSFKDYSLVDPHPMYKRYNREYYIRRDEMTEDGLKLFFGREFWSWSQKKLLIPSDEEMLEDFFRRDLPNAAA